MKNITTHYEFFQEYDVEIFKNLCYIFFPQIREFANDYRNWEKGHITDELAPKVSLTTTRSGDAARLYFNLYVPGALFTQVGGLLSPNGIDDPMVFPVDNHGQWRGALMPEYCDYSRSWSEMDEDQLLRYHRRQARHIPELLSWLDEIRSNGILAKLRN